MSQTKSPKNLDQAYDRLKQIHQTIESGQVGLEESVPLFKEASQLAKFLKQRLSEIETQIEEISQDFTKITESEKDPS